MDYIQMYIRKPNIYQNIKFWVPYLLCVACSVLYSINESFVWGTVSTIIACVVVSRITYDECYIFLFGIQFLRSTLRVYVGSSDFSILLFVYFVFFIRILKNNGFKVNKTQILPAILFIWDILVSINSGTLELGDSICWVGSLILLIWVIFSNIELDCKQLINVFIIAMWAILVINILAELRLYGTSLNPGLYGTWINNRYFSFGKAYSKIGGGNEIAQYIPYIVAFCVLSIKGQPLVTKVFWIGSCVFFCYCGTLCISRAFYVEMAVFLVLLLVNNSKNPVRLVVMIGFISFLAYFLFYNYIDKMQSLIDAVLFRFSQGNGNRELLVSKAEDFLSQASLLSFVGLGSYYPNVLDFTAHNIILDSFVSFGYIGGIIYWITLVVVFLKQRILKSFNLKNCIPLIMFVIYKLVSGSVRDVPFYFIISIMLLFARKNAEEEDCSCMRELRL